MHTADFKLRATGDDVFALYASDCEKPIDFPNHRDTKLVACRLLPAMPSWNAILRTTGGPSFNSKTGAESARTIRPRPTRCMSFRKLAKP